MDKSQLMVYVHTSFVETGGHHKTQIHVGGDESLNDLTQTVT